MTRDEENDTIGEVAACPRRAEERSLGPDLTGVDRVAINFDGEIPSNIDAPLIFHLNVKRGNRESRVRFQIDLQKLAEADLQRLHDFLSTRPKGYRLAYKLSWLLNVSLEQEMPATNLEVRRQKVRELLLCSEEHQL